MNNYFDDNPRGKSRGGSNEYFRENRRPVQVSGRGSVRGSSRGNSRGGPRGGSRKGKAPVPMLIVIDVFITALLLLIFYVTNYEMQGPTGPIASLPVPSSFTSSTPAVTTPEVTESPSVSSSSEVTETPAPSIDPNDWRAKFSDKFTSGEPVQTENSYKSNNISVTIEKVQEDNLTYFVADIYVAELKYFKTAFPVNADKMGEREFTDKVATEVNAVLAINGDHCVDNPGAVVRNGQMYREASSSLDMLVMNYDGSMQTYSPDEFDMNKIKTEGAYQVWGFGPMLLKDGKPMTEFNSTLGDYNPRTAVGYYEPGHYCFVVVDGRQPGYSDGMTLTQLSQLFADRGCTAAYNMDGGRSAEMAFMGKLVSHPMEGRRSTTDILYVGE